MISRHLLLTACLALAASTVVRASEVPAFNQDVLPILRAHCLQCHGADQQKNGLDLRTHAGALKGGKTGSAVRLGSLRDSVLWQFVATDKMPATAQKLSDNEKDILRRWIVAGAPLEGTGTTVREKTAKKPLVKQGVPALAQRIDSWINQGLQKAKIPASPATDDAEFLRRVYLDLTGRVPTLDQTLAFLTSKDPNRRTRLVDELLASPAYGQHFATIWHKLLIPKSVEKYRSLNHAKFTAWLAQSFNAGRGWDVVVTDLLTATGPVPPGGNQAKKERGDEKPAAVYLMSFEVDRRIQPKLIAASASRLFLAQSIECAQCHNHPQAKWRRADFWGTAAFFDRVRVEGKEKFLKEPDRGKEMVFEQKGADRRYVIPAIQPKPVIDMEDGTEKRTGKLVPAKFLDGDLLNPDTPGPYRPILAKWATAKDNAFFARAAVNRWWGHLLGRGLVEPLDDMSEDNPASHPELLDELAREFAAADFDLKHLIRCIIASQAYQRTSVPLRENLADRTLFSRQYPRQLSAEVLFDSLAVVVPGFETGTATTGKNKKKVEPGKLREEFLVVLDAGDATPTEFSRGLQQALRLMNGDGATFGAAALTHVLKKDATPEENIERIYLTVLSRRPSTTERQRMLAHVQRPGMATERYGDVFWALLNSGEFIINH